MLKIGNDHINLYPKVDKYDNRSAHSRGGSKVMGCVQPGMHISLCRKEGANGTGIYKYDMNLLRSERGFMCYACEYVTQSSIRSNVYVQKNQRGIGRKTQHNCIHLITHKRLIMYIIFSLKSNIICIQILIMFILLSYKYPISKIMQRSKYVLL